MNKRICTIKILDEVTCIFIGLHPDHIGYFYEEYGVTHPQHFFNPKFKLGGWDGKIRYFHKTGKTHVFLLGEIIPRVVRLGYSINLVDQRQTAPALPPPIEPDFLLKRGVLTDEGELWTMRDYQVDMVNTLLANGHGVGIAGTGAGKTSMTAALALAYEDEAGFKSLIIVPDKNLTQQTFQEYERFKVDVGEFSGERKDLEHQHVVSTWQALKNRPTLIQEFDMVIVDECHGLKGKELTKLLNEFGKDIPYRFGVTGTLPKDPTDAMAVRIAVGDVQYTIPAHILIKQGWLANIHIDVKVLDINLQMQYKTYLSDTIDLKPMTYIQFKDSYFPEWQAEKSFLQTDRDRLEWVARYVEGRRKTGNVLFLVNGVAVGRKLEKMVENSVFVYGKDRMKARKKVYEMYKTRDDLVVFATVHIASTGLDIKRIFHMMYLDMGKSFIRTIQTIGRGLRKAHDKDAVLVTDICSNLKYGKRHMRERMNYYTEAKYPFKKYLVDY